MRQLQAGEPIVIGSYRLVGVLGAGGMGQVFLGVGPDGRLAAIKQVLASFTREADFRARFAREVEACRTVSGAYTAAVLDADPNAPTPWLASLFVPGPALDAALEAYGPLPMSSMRLLTVGLVTALREIHRVGLVHRDLKPSNVLLTEDGPRVIDFGIATAVDGANRLTQTGAVIGSPGFMSPEQVDGHPMTPASDVFSLGSVLTYAVTGVGPFGDAPASTLMYRIAYHEPDLSRVPPPLHGVVRGCLIKNPGQRPTLDQILQVTGPVPPGEDWLPPPVRQMIHSQRHAANQLAGAHPRPTVEPAHAPYPTPRQPSGHPGYRQRLQGGPPEFAPGPRSRRPLVALLGIGALVAVLAVVLSLVFILPSDELSPEEAAALVTAIAPGPDEIPEGFRVSESGQRHLDQQDPLRIDRSATTLACLPQTDPPVPSEAGMVAVFDGGYFEDANELDVINREDRTLDLRHYTVAYLDADRRATIMTDIRARIQECASGGPRARFQDFRFSSTEIPTVQNVGFLATLPDDDSDQVDLFPQVLNCEYARIDAIVLRSCNLVTNDSGTRTGHDEEVRAMTRESLLDLVARARREQEPS